jgi:hypothetical protein
VRRHLLFLGVLGVLIFFLAIASKEDTAASRAMIQTSNASFTEDAQLPLNPPARPGRAPASIVIEPVTANE